MNRPAEKPGSDSTRPSRTPVCLGTLSTANPERVALSLCRAWPRLAWPRRRLGAPLVVGAVEVAAPLLTAFFKRFFAQALGDACRLGLSRQNSWNPLVRLPLPGQPGSSTPAGFARMEPALCRIPSPYPSPWRPRKSRDRARPGWEVVAPRVTAPSSCHTFRLFSIVLGTEKSYNLKGPFGRN